jgi:DNA polymerase I-like protein with 3'-5' exonuclease and polymerase domains
MLTSMGRRGEPVRTWGGRLYYAETPRVAKSGAREGEVLTFEYKLLNYLIQGSAADCTKEAIIRYHDVTPRASHMLVTVHDEINISAPKKEWEKEDKILKDAMESIKFDVPMLTDRKVGPSWGDLKEIE